MKKEGEPPVADHESEAEVISLDPDIAEREAAKNARRHPLFHELGSRAVDSDPEANDSPHQGNVVPIRRRDND